MASLAASVAKVGSSTLVSRILGFLRDLVIARLFGADAATDAFFVAFRIPNFLRRLFAEGAFALAVVPVLNEYREQRPPAEIKSLVDSLAGTLAVLLLAITILGVVAAPVLLLLFAPGFASDLGQRELAGAMLRLTFPYLLFVSLTALAGGILNTYERFGVPAFTPALLNLVLIACAVWLAPRLEQPVVALAWGVLIAGVVQLAFQLPFLASLGLLPRPRFQPAHEGVRRILRGMAPALVGVSVTQVSLLIDTLLASFLAEGSISWLYYSERLVELPLGLLGVALATVILPRLVQASGSAAPSRLSRPLDWGLRWVLVLGLPASVGLMVLAGPILATLFHSSEFGAQDVTRASHSLIAYAAGLAAFMAVKVLAPGYYARHDTRRPVQIAVVATLANLALSLILMGPFGHAGLAFATSLAALINAGLLLRGLTRQGVYRPEAGWWGLVLKVLVATTLMAAALHLGSETTVSWLTLGDSARVAHLVVWIAAGGLIYVVSLLMMGLRPHHLRERG